jgi:hypothetical protein
MKAAVVAVFLAFLSFGSLAFAARPEATTLNSYPAYLGSRAHLVRADSQRIHNCERREGTFDLDLDTQWGAQRVAVCQRRCDLHRLRER